MLVLHQDIVDGGPAGIRTQGLRLRGPTRFLARDCIQATPRAHEHIQLNGPKYNSLINFKASRFVASTQGFKEKITRNRLILIKRNYGTLFHKHLYIVKT